MNLLTRIVESVPAVRDLRAKTIREVQQLRDSHALANHQMQERLAELELALEEQGWLRFTERTQSEFSSEGLAKIRQFSRLMWLKNPLINRAVMVQALYVWAQGCTITADDEAAQETIDAFLNDPKNQDSFSSHQARTMAECDLQCMGELWFAFFASMSTGTVQIRRMKPDEIVTIITNPDDTAEPWFYLRRWNQEKIDLATGMATSTQMNAYYPALGYEPEERPGTIGGKPVMWDTPVYHVRVGCLSDMQRGVPETYQALDWAMSHTGFLSDWVNIVKAYARFAWEGTTPGGQQAVNDLQARLNTRLTAGNFADSNPPPNVGSAFISNSAKLTPIRTAGATTSADDGRQVKLMVCSAFGLPETFFGDVSVGTLATAKSLDRATELKFRDRQQLWESIQERSLQYVIARSRSAANGGMRVVGDKKVNITIEFPPILEHDIAAQMSAIVMGATLDGKQPAQTIDWQTTARLVLTALQVPNIDEVLVLLEQERAEAEEKREEMMQMQAEQPKPPADEGVKEAAKALIRAVDVLRENHGASLLNLASIEDALRSQSERAA